MIINNIDPIAVLAAFVSICTLFWLIWKERPRIKIDIAYLSAKKDKKYYLYVTVINKTGHPIRIDSYGVDFIREPKHKQSISILVSDGDKERIIKERDHLDLPINLDLIKGRDEKIKLLSFFILDSTYHTYSKKIPARIARDFTK